MNTLPDPRLEACATARLIEARASSLVGFARTISESPDPTALKPEDWTGMISSLDKLLEELKDEIETFAHKARYGT